MSKIAFRMAIPLALVIGLVAGFLAGWWAHDAGDTGGRVLVLEGGRGFTTLISSADVVNRAIFEPAGIEVDFLDNSDMNVLDPSGRYLFTSHETGGRAGVTRIDLQANVVDIIVADEDFTRLDGLLWTPWNSLLVSEEVDGGRLFEITNPLDEPGVVEFVERTAFGRRKHEGHGIDARGFLYGVDESPEGAIYRFRPESPLTPRAFEQGEMDVLVIQEDIDLLEDRRVAATWRRFEEGVGTPFDRPEDIEIVGDVLYVAITGQHRVLSIDLVDPESTTVGEYLSEESNAPSLDWPDNLAADAQGNMYVAEDLPVTDLLRGKRNEIWYAVSAADPLAPALSVELIATIDSGRDEPSGLLVNHDGTRLYVNLIGSNGSMFAVNVE